MSQKKPDNELNIFSKLNDQSKYLILPKYSRRFRIFLRRNCDHYSYLTGKLHILLYNLQFERLRDLHSLGVVHNDIKLDNLLIDNCSKAEADTIHLIDFGLSHLFEKINTDGTKKHI